MSSYRLVLQLTSALFAFAAVLGSASRDIGVAASNPSHGVIGFVPFYESREECLTDPLPVDITFYYYTKQFPSGRVFDFESPPTDNILKSTLTKLVTHGFASSLQQKEIQDLIKAYLESDEEINLLALDWHSYTKEMYRQSAKATVNIGKGIKSIYCILYKYYDIYPHQMHFIGHNLGAHLLAVTAREAKTKIGRLTGLDPARLCFEDQCNGLHYPQISKSDATFVDIIHTDCLQTGVVNSHGTADFYANQGKFQPGCQGPLNIIIGNCDSLQSIVYFAQTIRSPFAYYADFCVSPYPNLICHHNGGTYYGEFMGTAPRGIYNFKTNATVTKRRH